MSSFLQIRELLQGETQETQTSEVEMYIVDFEEALLVLADASDLRRTFFDSDSDYYEYMDIDMDEFEMVTNE